MRRKKRRPDAAAEDCCPEKQSVERWKDEKIHILSLYDDLEAFLAPCAPDIHRVRVPAASGKGKVVWRGLTSSSVCTDHGNLNPKPYDSQKDGCSNTFGESEVFGPLLDLKLSAEALKEPSQVFMEGFEKLLEMKFGIMALRIRHGLDAWSLGSQMVNPFEILSSVAATPVLSRAYFKMWELIETFDLVPSVAESQRFLSAHLCEGPGGFIEAVLDYRAQSFKCEDNVAVVDSEADRGDWSTLGKGIGAGSTSSDSRRAAGTTEYIPRSSVLQTTSCGEKPKPADTHPPAVVTVDTDEFAPRPGIEANPPRGIKRLTDTLAPNETLSMPTCASSLSEKSPKVNSAKQYHDLWFGLTLASTQQYVPGGNPPRLETRRLNEKVAGNSEGHVHYGVDGSGNVTNPSNVSAFVEYTLGHSEGQRMDLVTADGAFDVSDDFSSQEHNHLRLVFCEVVSALRLQAKGGSLVLKLFDCYTASTLSILFILSSLYHSVEIVRLRTTRVCNSERYVVAKGFSELSPELETTLCRLNKEWSEASKEGDKVGVLLSGGLPEGLLRAVMESNGAIAAVQIDAIKRALQLADAIGERLPPPDSFGRRRGLVNMLRRKLRIQERMQRNAVELCNELRIPCRSRFSS